MGADYDEKVARKILGLYLDKIEELKKYCDANMTDFS